MNADDLALANSLNKTNLYLIGLMGAGKSTVGQLLAQRLGYQFFDTDVLVEQVARQSIATLFATAGEAAFRDLETQVLAELSAYGGMAIATGGGIVLKRQNWSYLHHGVVIWLDASVDVLYERLKQSSDRPLLQTANPQHTLQQLFEQRQPLYAQADVQVTVQAIDTPEQVSNNVLTALRQVITPNRLLSADMN